MRHVCRLLVGKHKGKTAVGGDGPWKKNNIKVNIFRLQV
jgi:hypothetical protein